MHAAPHASLGTIRLAQRQGVARVCSIEWPGICARAFVKRATVMSTAATVFPGNSSL